jgi:hypothetical protein
MNQKGHTKQNTKKELKETLNWTSSTENRGTGRNDDQASVHPMFVGRSDALVFGARLSAFGDQVKSK